MTMAMDWSTTFVPNCTLLSIPKRFRFPFRKSRNFRKRFRNKSKHQIAVHQSHRPPPHRSLTIKASSVSQAPSLTPPGLGVERVNMVYKFGGSSLADSKRIEEVAEIICSFREHYPCIVLSAMGKTTNQLLTCGKRALSTPFDSIQQIPELTEIYNLHVKTAVELNVDNVVKDQVLELLKELEQLLTGIAMLKELSPKAQDTLVSFGERLSTRLFSGYLNSQGVQSVQFDAWDFGFTSTDDFTNAEILLDPTLSKIKKSIHELKSEVPVVTGFLAQGVKSGAITTLGRGGSDLTATVIGLALGLSEVQVWKDVDGILTSDPRIVPEARPLPVLTYEEANELAFFGAQVLHPRAMKPAAMSPNSMAVRVKNSYNRCSPGTLIKSNRELKDVLLTSIVIKRGISVVDVVSTSMVGQFGFLADVFEVFKRNKISVDVVATSEISVSITLDVDRFESQEEWSLETLKKAFENWAEISVRKDLAIISLICNIERTSEILEVVFRCLRELKINVQMMSQGASKTNISLIVDQRQVNKAVQTIHKCFFNS